MRGNEDVHLTCLFGVAKYEPPKYFITRLTFTRRWWQLRPQEQFFIETEYSRLGPYKSEAQAREVLSIARLKAEPGLRPCGVTW